MRRVILFAILALALPIAAVADSHIDFNAQGGTLSGSSAGLQLTSATLMGIGNLYGTPLSVGSNLGTVSFTTGPMLSGSLASSATFSGAGSTFMIVGNNGISGVPSGTIFSGSFTTDVTLTESGTGLHSYFLTGVVAGTLSNGGQARGPVILDFTTGKGWMGEPVTIGSVDTTVVIPEPGTLGLLGTGLLAVGGLLHRKLRNG